MNGIAQVFDVRENPDLSSYDHIVAGGANRSGKVSAELQDYLRKHQAMLAPKIRVFSLLRERDATPGDCTGKKPSLTNIWQHFVDLRGTLQSISRKNHYGLMDEASRENNRGFGMPEYDQPQTGRLYGLRKGILNKSV